MDETFKAAQVRLSKDGIRLIKDDATGVHRLDYGSANYGYRICEWCLSMEGVPDTEKRLRDKLKASPPSHEVHIDSVGFKDYPRMEYFCQR